MTSHIEKAATLPKPVAGRYGVTATAVLLKCSRATLHRWIRTGYLQRSYGLIPESDSPIRFREVDVLETLDRMKASATATAA